MTIPANITTELASLQAQVAAAAPLKAASRATIKALQLNAAQLVSDVQTALVAPGNLLDTWVAPADPSSIIAGVNSLVVTAVDQGNLSLMRGVIGRATSNLDQLV
jgi:hypothetical protein